MLWNRSLVMRDLETGSLWSHILGRAMRGPLLGKVLTILPAELTTWADWSGRHPQTSVLNLTRTADDYHTLDSQLGARGALGYGIRVAGETKAYSRQYLAQHPLLHDVVGGQPVLLVSDVHAVRTVGFFRGRDEGVLEFESDEDPRFMRERGAGFRWRALDGARADGSGAPLERVVGYITYLRAWERFFPDSVLVGTDE